MTELSRLPKGVWYETKRRRYRVRKYHNMTIYGPWYFRTLDDALAKYEELMEELSAIPKVYRRVATPKRRGEI